MLSLDCGKSFFTQASGQLYFEFLSLSILVSLSQVLYHPSTQKRHPSFFILFSSLSVYREWCLGSHVTFCLNTIAGVCHWPFFFERALVSRVTGNGGTTSLFSPAAPSRLRCSDLVSLSLSLCRRLFVRLWIRQPVSTTHTYSERVVSLFLLSFFSFFIRLAVAESIRLQEVSETNDLICLDLGAFFFFCCVALFLFQLSTWLNLFKILSTKLSTY